MFGKMGDKASFSIAMLGLGKSNQLWSVYAFHPACLFIWKAERIGTTHVSRHSLNS